MTTTAPQALTDVYALPIDRVTPNPDNPRRVTDAHPSLPGIAQTMKEIGQLQPIVARALPDGGWVIIAGERRWRAARLAGLETIEAKVVDVDEQRAFEMTVVENLQRDDLHWTEEARGVETMVKRGWDVATMASHVGRSEQWVRLRAKLASISPKWRTAVEDPKSPFRTWSASMLELIARFPVVTQEALLAKPSWELEQCGTTADLQRYLDVEVSRELKHAPWDLADASLVPKAGACGACPKRSSCQQLLFAESKEDRCLDASCWKAKAEASIVARVTAAKKASPKTIVLGDYEAPKALRKQVQSPWSFREVKAGAKGATPAIWVTGEKAGQQGFVVKGMAESSSRSKAKTAAATSPKEQLADHLKRRTRAVIETLVEKLGGSKSYGEMKPAAADVRVPGSDVLLAIAMTFGLDGTSSVWAPDWKAFQKTRALKGAELNAQLWDACRDALVQVLESQANARGGAEIDVAGVETIALMCGLDWKALTAAARDAHPLPKKLAEQFDENGKPLKALTAKPSPAPKPKTTAKPKAKAAKA